MKKCKYCKSEIDEKAKVCPVCRKEQGPKVGLIIFLVIVGIIIISVAAGGGNGSKSTESYTSTEKFSHNVSKSYDDGYSYYIEGTVTNNLDKDYSYVQIEFICYDKTGNNIGTALDNTNNLLAKETWKFKAMGMFTDQKVDHCDYKEVTGW